VKFSYNWLKELVDGLDTGAEELSRLITMKTAESEGVEHFGAHFANVRAAAVTAVEQIAGSKNVKAVVNAGSYGERTVVCGAPNCRPGVVTAYVPAGTSLDGREIRKSKIAGIESDGMLAAGVELGINRDHDGILELDLAPGDPLPCEPDAIIDIDNKSLTHRPDLWGHHGMAREVAAILHKALFDPAKLDRLPAKGNSINVEIQDYTLCPRYSALVFDNVTVGPSPLWLQYRLQAVGLNPISDIVDVTNYVMAEIAQPMHAFDADKLHGDTIFVRPAEAGERIVALNDEEYVLGPSNLVIADAAGPVAIAGVIGGRDSAIGPDTRRIVLESANFQAASVRKTSAALKLRTDASMRFEKAQDPTNTVRGLVRAIDLLRQVSPGVRLAGGLADEHTAFTPPPPIELPLQWLDLKLGRAVADEQVRTILEALQFGVEESSPRVFSVTVPSWRATKDISIKDDLVEEVGRMIGYDSITPQAPVFPATVPPVNKERQYHHGVRDMAAAQGFTEVYNYSFISEDLARKFGMDPDHHVRVQNPIAADQSLLRMSLVPRLWTNIEENEKYFDTFRLFEIGKEIHRSLEGLPNEVTHLAAAMYTREDSTDSLFELKRLAECIQHGLRVSPTSSRSYEHPSRTVDVLLGDVVVGHLFELHPSLVEHGRASILDIDLDVLMQLRPTERRYKPVQRFPSSAFDLSIVADLRDLAGDIQMKLASFAGSELQAIEFVRQYAGPPLPEGKKSVSYRLTVAAPDRTLSSDDVAAIRNRIIDGMRGIGYDLRV
jgi:phenylalanyl-tRNA synthetase beta chain